MADVESLFFETEMRWEVERRGVLQGQGLPSLNVDAPPEFKGRGGSWTPEHLFVASVTACFATTLLAIAENSKLEIVSFSTKAKGKLEKVAGGGYQVTEITLQPDLKVRSTADLSRAARIVEKAEKNCFITNSIKSRVKLEPQIYHDQTPVYPCPKGSDP